MKHKQSYYLPILFIVLLLDTIIIMSARAIFLANSSAQTSTTTRPSHRTEGIQPNDIIAWLTKYPQLAGILGYNVAIQVEEGEDGNLFMLTKMPSDIENIYAAVWNFELWIIRDGVKDRWELIERTVVSEPTYIDIDKKNGYLRKTKTEPGINGKSTTESFFDLKTGMQVLKK